MISIIIKIVMFTISDNAYSVEYCELFEFFKTAVINEKNAHSKIVLTY